MRGSDTSPHTLLSPSPSSAAPLRSSPGERVTHSPLLPHGITEDGGYSTRPASDSRPAGASSRGGTEVRERPNNRRRRRVDFSSSLSFLPTNSSPRSNVLEIQTSLVHLPAFREMGPVQQQQQQQQQPSEMGEKVVAPASDSDRRRRTSSSSSPHVTIQEPGQPEHEEERLLSGSKSRRDARKSRTSRSADRRSSSTLASSSGGSRRSSAYSSRSVSSDRSSTASTSSTSAKSCAHSTCVLAEPCRRMVSEPCAHSIYAIELTSYLCSPTDRTLWSPLDLDQTFDDSRQRLWWQCSRYFYHVRRSSRSGD